jgi:hypothetical protein
MSPPTATTGMSLSQIISLAGFIIGFVTIWIHLEIRIAEINVDLTNLKQDILLHKTDNRKDFELLRSDNAANTREILRKVDEMQIYLRNHR